MKSEGIVETLQVEGMQFVSVGPSQVAVVMDSEIEKGGKGSGVRPMELVLHALAGCTAMDVVSILKKMREPWRDFRVLVRGNRAEDHPRVYTQITVEYVFQGTLNPEKVRKAVRLSQERYCSVSAMLRKTARIAVWIHLKDEEGKTTLREPL